jgi:hypothetical protein
LYRSATQAILPDKLKVLIMKKIKFVDKENKSKILLTVYWDKLKGNKQAYLSVTINQVVLNGTRIEGWKEQKEAIKLINLELFNLVSLHLMDMDGSNVTLSNASYYYSLTKNQLHEPINYTREQKQKDLLAYKQILNDPLVFSTIEKHCGVKALINLKEYLIESGDLFKYKDFTTSFDFWVKNYSNSTSYGYSSGKMITKKLTEMFKVFFETLTKYRKLKQDYKTYPSLNDIWTPERLTDFLGCDISRVYEMLVAGNTDTLTAIVKEQEQADLVFINEMTVRYNIETIYS